MTTITNYFSRNKSSMDTILVSLLLGALTLLLGLELFFALSWRMEHDVPNLHYVAFLIDRFDYVPYRDIFETNLPGIFLLHLAIGKLFGYGDTAFRWLDTFSLFLLSAVTWGILRRFGARVAWAAIVLFGLSYLQRGPDMSLQRDYVGLLAVATAVFLTIQPRSKHKNLRLVLIGLLFGLATAVKPHLAIGLPFILLYLLWMEYTAAANRRWANIFQPALKIGLLAIIGFIVPLALSFLWVWQLGALPYFIDLFSTYLPLYLQLDINLQIVQGFARVAYLLRNFQLLGGYGLWLVPAVLGLYLTVFRTKLPSATKQTALLLAALALTYSFYPVLSGQFFPYHWIPFLYFVILLAALVLVPLPSEIHKNFERLFPVLVLIGVILFSVRTAPNFRKQLLGKPPTPPKNGLVDEIATAIKDQNLAPGETVQPLDWTGGTIQALLIAEAPLATPYIYDYYFYHHISEPTIQALRADFLVALAAEMPRLIVENQNKARVSGPDTTTEFPALRQFMNTNYELVYETPDFQIYQLKKFAPQEK
ncbi:MAG: glycosyltransferase family 39 protein [Anaerolineales bacterium]|nr:glycosyltransferase family 39 protein [Anaerolineales bacterium]